MAKFNVLSTKVLEPALVTKAREKGIAITEQDAIKVQPMLTKEKWDEIFSLLQKEVQHAVFTSSNGVISLKKYLNTYVNPLPVQWKIFCISGKTAELLQEDEELFGTISGTAPHGAGLAQVIVENGANEVLFFSGNRRRDELPALLKEAGVQVHEVVMYETIDTPVEAKGDYDAVLFFSPSAVQSFFSVNQLKENTVCFAIGQTTADSLSQFTTNPVYLSKEPSQEALLNELFNYFKSIVGGRH
jgi:uroporphyrinogen-III synthase